MSSQKITHYVERADVAVVGAGPGGLACALTLAMNGIATTLVERRTSPSPLPRANTLSTGTMELLRRWGLETAVRERALDVEMRPLAVTSLAAAATGTALDAGFPTRDQAALVSPTAPAAVGQDELEPLLEARARAVGARVRRGLELTGLARAEDGYVLRLADAQQRPRTVRARFVVGADGLRSRVREELGIAVERDVTVDRRLAIHFRAPLWEVVGERKHVIYFLDDRAVLPTGRPDRWALALGSDGAAGSVPRDRMTGWIRAAAGVPGLPVEVDHADVVDYGVGLAERFRDGDAFLVGDAAHRVTPRGATGLNTAIRDGFDLGWRLAWVLRGWVGDELLDGYERERRPVAEFNTGRSMRADGSLLDTVTGVNADVGGRIAHVWVQRPDGADGPISTLDLLGEGLTLFAGAGGPISTLDLLGDGLTRFAGPEWRGDAPAHPPGGPPVRTERLDAIGARGLGLTPTGALLARPDGHPLVLSNQPAAGVLAPLAA